MDTDVTEEITTKEVSVPQRVERTTKQVTPAIKTEHPQKVFEKKKAIFRVHQVVWYILVIIEVLLGFRIVLKALGANPASGFVNLIYTFSDPLALPFRGIFRTSVASGSVFEWSTIIAVPVYALIGFGIVQLMQLIKPVTPHEVTDAVDNT